MRAFVSPCNLLLIVSLHGAAFSLPCLGTADDIVAQDEATETYAWAKATFAEIDCRSNGQSARPLEANHRPILRFSNEEVGGVYGDIFLYTKDRRPTALIALYAWHRPNNLRKFAEFVSLSSEPIKATMGETVLWDTGPSSITWKRFDSSSVPANVPTLRLSQMRQLASRFEIVLETSRNSSETERHLLRKLSRPLYRYSAPDHGILDGAMFAFVASTDPDAVLLVEARKNELGEATWHYALARVNYSAMTVKLDDKVVERFPLTRQFKFVSVTRPYSVFRWIPTPDADNLLESSSQEAR